MEVFSLEDDDCEGMFITQEPSKLQEIDGDKSVLGDGLDFSSPCVSLTSQSSLGAAVYEDISDNDAFDIPCSEPPKDVKE